MANISFPKKPRKDTDSGIFTIDGKNAVIGKDWALQNEMDEVKAITKSRGCYKECRTCGTCANSKRDNFLLNDWYTDSEGKEKVRNPHKSYDDINGEWVNCRDCEPFRYHDCNNGFLRNAHGEAELFTEDMYKIMDQQNGKPLI